MRISKDPEERRQELIETATQLFLEKGYEKTIIRDIVNKAGVTQGLFYYYFTSKEDIMKAIVTYYSGIYVKQLTDSGFDSCTNPIEGIRLVLQEGIVFVNTYRDLITDIHKEGNERLHDLIAFAFTEEIAAIFEKLLVIGNESGIFHCKYPQKSASAFIFGLFYTIHVKDGGVMADRFIEEKEFIIYHMAQVFGIEEKLLEGIFGESAL